MTRLFRRRYQLDPVPDRGYSIGTIYAYDRKDPGKSYVLWTDDGELSDAEIVTGSEMLATTIEP
jgi:hypothetical protein